MTATFKPNWLAIFFVLVGLVVAGWLLGLLSAAPDGKTITCEQEDMVQIVGGGKGVLVYCEEY